MDLKTIIVQRSQPPDIESCWSSQMISHSVYILVFLISHLNTMTMMNLMVCTLSSSTGTGFNSNGSNYNVFEQKDSNNNSAMVVSLQILIQVRIVLLCAATRQIHRDRPGSHSALCPFDDLHFKPQKNFGLGQDLNNLQMKEKQRADNI